MSALYIISPQSWIVDCLMADFEVGKYKKAYLVWTSCALLAMWSFHEAQVADKYASQSSTRSSVSDWIDLNRRANTSLTTGF